MSPNVSDFISGFLEDKNTHIEVEYRNHVNATIPVNTMVFILRDEVPW